MFTGAGTGSGVDGYGHFSFASMIAELAQKHPLPRTQIQTAAGDRNGQGDSGDGRFDVGRHVIISLHHMGIMGLALRNQMIEAASQILTNGRIRIFIDDEPGRGMVQKQMHQTIFRPIPYLFRNGWCNQMKTPFKCRKNDFILLDHRCFFTQK